MEETIKIISTICMVYFCKKIKKYIPVSTKQIISTRVSMFKNEQLKIFLGSDYKKIERQLIRGSIFLSVVIAVMAKVTIIDHDISCIGLNICFFTMIIGAGLKSNMSNLEVIIDAFKRSKLMLLFFFFSTFYFISIKYQDTLSSIIYIFISLAIISFLTCLLSLSPRIAVWIMRKFVLLLRKDKELRASLSSTLSGKIFKY